MSAEELLSYQRLTSTYSSVARGEEESAFAFEKDLSELRKQKVRAVEEEDYQTAGQVQAKLVALEAKAKEDAKQRRLGVEAVAALEAEKRLAVAQENFALYSGKPTATANLDKKARELATNLALRHSLVVPGLTALIVIADDRLRRGGK